MKKAKIIFLILLVLLVFFALSPVSSAEADSHQNLYKSIFIMPDSLKMVEDEAFEGTAVKTLVFRDGLVSVGDSAFENACNLTDVYIPSTVKLIGKNAFSLNKKLTIHGVIGSLAEKWAKEHQVPFVPSNIWNVVNDGGGTDHSKSIFSDRVFQAIYYESYNHLHGRTEDEGKSMRPQERPELNPIDYRFP